MKDFDQLDITDCDKLIRNYVCSQCWGTLVYNLNKGTPKSYTVSCPKCGIDIGFVTRDYAERRRGESNAEAIEATRNIGGLLGIKPKQFDRDKVIKELWPD